jgi:hypothetical protein
MIFELKREVAGGSAGRIGTALWCELISLAKRSCSVMKFLSGVRDSESKCCCGLCCACDQRKLLKSPEGIFITTAWSLKSDQEIAKIEKYLRQGAILRNLCRGDNLLDLTYSPKSTQRRCQLSLATTTMLELLRASCHSMLAR